MGAPTRAAHPLIRKASRVGLLLSFFVLAPSSHTYAARYLDAPGCTLFNPTPSGRDRFGAAVALSRDGLVLVGAPGDDDTGFEDAGMAYLFDCRDGRLIKKLPNPDPANGAAFGRSVAFSGLRCLVGAPGAEAAYVLDCDPASATVGDRLLKLVPPPPPCCHPAAGFGSTVASAGVDLLVGAPSEFVSSDYAGAVYLFQGNTGMLRRRLPNPEPGIFEYFGSSLSAVEEGLIIGAPGDGWPFPRGLVYVIDAAQGETLAICKVPANEPSPGIGASVAASGTTILAGGSQQVHVFTLTGATCAHRRAIQNPGGPTNEGFGAAVALVGGGVVAGIGWTDFAIHTAFLISLDTGSLIHRFLNPTPTLPYEDLFGLALATEGTTVLVGAPGDDEGGEDSGAAYLFPLCGDGVADPGEQCDDGNNLDTDCCSADCRFEPLRSPCMDDRNVCTDDECDGAGVCVHPANTAPCSDGLFCNGSDTCAGGSCAAHAGDPCATGGECADACNEAADNCFDLRGTPCSNDGLFCTGAETCDGVGACRGSGDPCVGGGDCADVCNESADNCLEPRGAGCADDGNLCTNDQCDGAGRCVHQDNAAACDDGIFCNGIDICQGGACSLHSGDPCEGGEECADRCNEAGDNCFEPQGTPCSDDGNICTTDQCSASGRCVHAPNTVPCDDGLFCNGTDRCGASTCSVHSGDPCGAGTECARTCDEAGNNCLDPVGTTCTDDGNACTDDQCDGTGACVHPPRTGPCDDGLFCTVGETCSGGVCGGGAARDCSVVADQCNRGVCNEVSDRCGAEVTNDGERCDDGNVCTTGEVCSAGVCRGILTSATDCTECDDGDVCTVDICVRAGGCDHAPVNFDSLGSVIACGVEVDACSGQEVPDAVARLRDKADELIKNAESASNQRKANRLIKAAVRSLKKASKKAVKAGNNGTIAVDCAQDISGRINSERSQAKCLVRRP